MRFIIIVLLISSITYATTPNNTTNTNKIYEQSRSTDDYLMYHHSGATWFWYVSPPGMLLGVNFDPTDNNGDITDEDYEVSAVDIICISDENMAPPPDDFDLYLCNDDSGEPDLSNPLWESTQQYHAGLVEVPIDPPVHFNGGEICWVVIDSPGFEENKWLWGSDGDGNSGHSWFSDDGGSNWHPSMEGTQLVDWTINLYAHDSNAIATTSLGEIKAVFE